MVEQSQKDPVAYDSFYKEYSVFLKEGIVISDNSVDKVNFFHMWKFLTGMWLFTWIYIL